MEVAAALVVQKADCSAAGVSPGGSIVSVAGFWSSSPWGAICTAPTRPWESGSPSTAATGVMVISRLLSRASFGTVSVYFVPSAPVEPAR
jgi:hypothetical protein